MNPPSRGRAPARALGLGVCGLGRAFAVMRAAFAGDPRVRLVGAADPRPEARARFAREFAAPAHETLEALCADPAVEAVYVASPHELHAEHTVQAARAGRHVLVEKPMAVRLDEANAMVDAAADAGVHVVVGPSHGFDVPVLRARALIASGRYGRVRMIHAFNYTDFLYRPRRPEELDTDRGGGVVFSQGAHQVDVVRLLGGGVVRTVRAHTGAWDPGRPTEGAYAATLALDDGAFASLVYSGYGHFDSDELCGWVGELGGEKDPSTYGRARRALAGAPAPAAEAALKTDRAYGGAAHAAAPEARVPPHHEHFGFVLVSCEGADLRVLPDGVMVYDHDARRLEPVAPPAFPRRPVLDELHGAVVHDRAPLHGGPWGRATLEVCLGILDAARSGAPVPMHHQVGVGPT